MRILTTADDFGYSKDTFEATVKCLKQRLVENVSIMPNMPFSSEALKFADKNPQFCYGIHLTLCEDKPTKPISDLSKIRNLIDKEGLLFRGRKAQLFSLFSLYPVDELAVEIDSQIRLVGNYCEISYVDSHWHLHKYKPFREALSQVLPRHGIQCVRRPQNVFLRGRITHPTNLFARRWGNLINSKFQTTSHFYMPTSRDSSQWPRDLLGMLDGNSIEIGVHPGTQDSWRYFEVESLNAFHALLTAGSIQTVSWREFLDGYNKDCRTGC